LKTYWYAFLCGLLAFPALCIGQNYDWQPITPQDLQFKEIPGYADAPAVLLYHADYIKRKRLRPKRICLQPHQGLEEEVSSWLPPQSTAKMNYSHGWRETSGSVVADLEIEVPSYAARTGNRLLLPSSLFPTKQKDIFRHAERRYPLYFPYAFSEMDLTVIKMPAGYSVRDNSGS